MDPALWYCHTVNRLELKLPGALTFLRADGLARLSSLTTLILAGNSALRRLLCPEVALELGAADAGRGEWGRKPPRIAHEGHKTQESRR